MNTDGLTKDREKERYKQRKRDWQRNGMEKKKENSNTVIESWIHHSRMQIIELRMRLNIQFDWARLYVSSHYATLRYGAIQWNEWCFSSSHEYTLNLHAKFGCIHSWLTEWIDYFIVANCVQSSIRFRISVELNVCKELVTHTFHLKHKLLPLPLRIPLEKYEQHTSHISSFFIQ